MRSRFRLDERIFEIFFAVPQLESRSRSPRPEPPSGLPVARTSRRTERSAGEYFNAFSSKFTKTRTIENKIYRDKRNPRMHNRLD